MAREAGHCEDNPNVPSTDSYEEILLRSFCWALLLP